MVTTCGGGKESFQIMSLISLGNLVKSRKSASSELLVTMARGVVGDFPFTPTSPAGFRGPKIDLTMPVELSSLYGTASVIEG